MYNTPQKIISNKFNEFKNMKMPGGTWRAQAQVNIFMDNVGRCRTVRDSLQYHGSDLIVKVSLGMKVIFLMQQDKQSEMGIKAKLSVPVWKF